MLGQSQKSTGAQNIGPENAAPETSAGSDPRRWLSLAGICLGAALVWLAFADLGVAIPSISKSVGGSLIDLQWANNAFSLVTGALVITAGRFGDMFGRKKMLLIGLAVLGLLSAVPALAPGVWGIVAGRALMGVGAACILPATLALIPPQFKVGEQARAFAVWMIVAWVGQAAGPAIGGILTQSLGWRWVFWINLPLAAVAFLVVRAITPESLDPTAPRSIDFAGLLTSSGAIFALLFGLTAGQDVGFTDPLILGMFATAIVLAVAFVMCETYLPNPLVDLSLFRVRPFDGALIANLSMNLVFGGVSFVLVLYLEEVRGYNPIEAGLLLLPSTVTILLLTPFGARAVTHIGPRLPMIIGTLVMGSGCLIVGFISTTSSFWLMALGLLVMGAGIGLMSTPIASTAVGGVPEKLAGTASGLFKMTSMIGGAVGVALLMTFLRVFETNKAVQLAKAAGLSAAEIKQLKAAIVDSKLANNILSGLSAAQRSQIAAATKIAHAAGTAHAVQASAIVAIVATLALVAVWPARRRSKLPEPEVEPSSVVV